MIDITAAVEDHAVDTLRNGALSDELADLLGGLDVPAAFEALLNAAGGAQSDSGHIVDDLGVNVVVAPVNAQTGALRRAGDLAADTSVALYALMSAISALVLRRWRN